jgi:hypothetical protein
VTVWYCLPTWSVRRIVADGWQQGSWAGAPVKGVVDGLAVDGRGNGVGEAFAGYEIDFAWWGLEGRSVPPTVGGASLLCSRWAGDITISRSGVTHVQAIVIAVSTCY